LERAISSSQLLILAGDKLDDSNTVKFQQINDLFGLSQHVSTSTHRDGHCIDIFVVTSADTNASFVRVDLPLTLSDHCHIVAKLDMKLQTQHRPDFTLAVVGAHLTWITSSLTSMTQLVY
jgi:hypothetical protein